MSYFSQYNILWQIFQSKIACNSVTLLYTRIRMHVCGCEWAQEGGGGGIDASAAPAPHLSPVAVRRWKDTLSNNCGHLIPK